MRRWLLLAAALVTPASAWAQAVDVVSTGPEQTSVVIYRDQPVDTAALMEQSRQPWARLDREGLALIVERRTIELPAGESVIRLRGVANGIIPQTAVLEGLSARMVERNTDFDLLSPGTLLDRSVGEVVRVVRTNPVTGEQVIKAALVRSGPQGTVLEIDGRLEALDCGGLTERIIFDRAPEGLSDQPVLSVRVRADQAGRHDVTLAYLATGLQWSADYVARPSADGRTLDLTGWITLANFGDAAFRNAPVHVVGGNLNRDDDTQAPNPVIVAPQPVCWPMDTTTNGAIPPSHRMEMTAPPMPAPPPAAMAMRADAGVVEEIVVTGSRIAQMAELGDYKMYTLPEPTDVPARQTKQVRFLELEGIGVTRLYQVRLASDDGGEVGAPQLLLRMENERENGLGVPLPGGSVALIEAPDGRRLFAGQTRFSDRAEGLVVEWAFGQAMGLMVERTAFEDRSNTAGDRAEFATTLTLTNTKSEQVEFEIAPNEYGYQGFRIVHESQRSRLTPGGYPAWRVRVPAGESRELSYTIRWDE